MLCLVDDAHWLDDASADALVFVSRRLDAEAIAILFAVREGEVRRFEPRGLPCSARRRPGSDRGGRADRSPSEPGSCARCPRAADRGNARQSARAAGAAFDPHAPRSARARSRCSIRCRSEWTSNARSWSGCAGCRRDTQELLLVAAADDTGDVAIVLSARRARRARRERSTRPSDAGLARVRGGRLELRHPLVRSAIYQGAPLSQRRAAHDALASVLDGEAQADRRAWHRVAACGRAGARACSTSWSRPRAGRRRSAFAAASRAFERAAAFTPDEPRRARRLTAAAESAWLAGRLDRALATARAGAGARRRIRFCRPTSTSGGASSS